MHTDSGEIARNYDADEDLRYDKFIEISKGVEDIITDLTNQTLDNLDIWVSSALQNC